MRVLSVVGARPQFVKLAPIAEALLADGHDHIIVHTGQHYDAEMSDVFFADLAIPAPTVHLGVGSGSHGVQTGAMLAAMDSVLDEHAPNWVLVYGDTNSTLAGAVSAVKLGIPLAHLEAGLRSFNRRMPEEHNRVLTDHAADLCLAPTRVAMDHLAREGLADRAVLVGDVMTDICLRVAEAVTGDPLPAAVSAVAEHAPDGFVVCTLHRAENTDDPWRLSSIIDALAEAPLPVVLLVHPRLAARASACGLELDRGSLNPSKPLAYPDLVATVLASSGVVTDSGGLQKEAFLLRRPCVTLRTETEWPETVDLGWNVLCPDPGGLGNLWRRPPPSPTNDAPYGDGQSAKRVVSVLENWPVERR